jgi:quinol monooxygenase YgiN
MIVEYIRYQTDPDRGGRLVEATAPPSPTSKAAPECLSQEVAVCTADPGSVTVRLLGPPSGAHEGFRKGPHFPPFLALVRPFISDIAEMRHYQPVVAG